MKSTLYYIHDPMCAWCWGFKPVREQIEERLPEGIDCEYVLGGLAPDSREPMSQETRDYIQANWRRIQQVIPGIEFNYDFWTDCQPRRSTYPACRAVLAAKQQSADYERPMITAIQQAYYCNAQNPSDDDTLIQLAVDLGLDEALFTTALNSEAIAERLEQHITFYHQLANATGVSGFPSLVLGVDGRYDYDNYYGLPRDYHNPDTVLRAISTLVATAATAP